VLFPTVAELAGLLMPGARAKAGHSSLFWMNPLQAESRRLFVYVHDLSGSVMAFKRFSMHTTASIPCVGVQCVKEDFEGGCTSLKDLALRHVARLEPSLLSVTHLYLVGFSLGCELALHIAEAFQGRFKIKVVLLDGRFFVPGAPSDYEDPAKLKTTLRSMRLGHETGQKALEYVSTIAEYPDIFFGPRGTLEKFLSLQETGFASFLGKLTLPVPPDVLEDIKVGVYLSEAELEIIEGLSALQHSRSDLLGSLLVPSMYIEASDTAAQFEGKSSPSMSTRIQEHCPYMTTLRMPGTHESIVNADVKRTEALIRAFLGDDLCELCEVPAVGTVERSSNGC